MRKIAIGIVIVVLVVVGGVLIFAATFNVNKYHDQIQSEVQKQLGRPVTLGSMSLGVFPPRFRVENVNIADDPAFSSQASFVKAQELDVSARLLPLLHKQIEVSSLNLQQPSVQLIRNRQGVWNYASLGHPSSAAPPSSTQPPSAQQQPAAAQQFSLGKLTIHDGQISVLDEQTSKSPSVYNNIDVTLSDYAPGKPFSIEAAAHLPGAGTELVRLRGQAGPIAQGQPANTPFHGTLNLQQVGLANLSQYLHVSALTGADGTITGETRIDNNSGSVTAKGETRIDDAKVRGQALGYPVDATYDLTDDLAASMITLRNVVLKLGTTPMQVSGTVNTKSSPAQLDVNTKADNVSVAELEKLAALFGSSMPPDMNVAGTINANVQARGPANKPALNGTITASNIQMSGKQLPQPVQIQAINVSLTPAQIQSNPFNVVSGGTTVNTQFSVRDYLAPSPIVAATIKAPNAQLPAILSIAKAYGVKSLDKVNGSGTLNVDLRASGPVKSLSSQEIMRALNGAINLNLNNVKYSGADISHEVSSIAKFLQPAAGAGQGVTTISKLTGDIQITNGIAQTKNLQAQMDWGNLGVTGSANLADQTLNMHGLAALSQSSSQKAGGTQIGGFMQTALADKQGQLVIPLLITGTFSSPHFAPDTQQLAQMKLKGLASDMTNPTSLVSTLQNVIGGKSPAQPQTQRPSTPQAGNPVQQIMGLFGGKKK